MSKSATHTMVCTSLDDPQQARALAAQLVEARLAACVQCLPAESTYRWEGAVTCAQEVLLQAKTTAARTDALIRFLETHHPYDTPEIVVIPVTSGSTRYLEWIDACTTPAPGGAA